MKARILFVDDDLTILDGIDRTLSEYDDESIGDVMGVIHDIISKSCYDVLLESKIRDAMLARFLRNAHEF